MYENDLMRLYTLIKHENTRFSNYAEISFFM